MLFNKFSLSQTKITSRKENHTNTNLRNWHGFKALRSTYGNPSTMRLDKAFSSQRSRIKNIFKPNSKELPC